MAQQYDPFADPHLADGLYGGLLPTPPDVYAAVWAYPRHLQTPAGMLVNHDLRNVQGQSLFAPAANQGAIGSCTAFCWGYYLRAALASKWHIENGSSPDLPDVLSARFLYDLERQIEGTYPQDSGATMLTGAKILVDYGCPPERDLPYSGAADNGSVNAELTDHVKEAAAFYAAAGYYRLAGTGTALVDSIVQCLHEGYPVAIAVLIPQSFTRTGSDGRVPTPNSTEQILGGHALCVAANYYDNSAAGGMWIGGPNSWGSAWGEQGWFWLPAAYATTNTRYGPMLQEAWTCR